MAGIASAVVDSGTTSTYAEGTSAGRQCGSNGDAPSVQKQKLRLIMGKLLIFVWIIPHTI